MVTTSLMRNTILGSLTGLVLCLAPQAFAMGEVLTIEQSTPASLGSWILDRPGGAADVHGSKSSDTQILRDTPAGSYTLYVDAPSGAAVTMDLYREGVRVDTIPHSTATFELDPGENLRVVINYKYYGTLSVDSNPRGAPFELRGEPGVRLIGRTPAYFSHLPPLTYAVTFGAMENCIPPRPQKRPMEENKEVTFYAGYTCDPNIVPSDEIGEGKVFPDFNFPRGIREERGIPEIEKVKNDEVRLIQSVQTKEVLPGGRIVVTLGVRNVGPTDLCNFTVRESFDPSQVSVVEPLADGGSVTHATAFWVLPTLHSGESWTTELILQLNDGLVAGDMITLVAGAFDEDLIENPRSTVTVGVTTLPATGSMYDTLAVALMALLAFKLTFHQIRRRKFVSLTA